MVKWLQTQASGTLRYNSQLQTLLSAPTYPLLAAAKPDEEHAKDAFYALVLHGQGIRDKLNATGQKELLETIENVVIPEHFDLLDGTSLKSPA
ncbi:MAG: hypothetical protein HS115_11605 [Spirochaetales bacterium]|nr:hypothetical protein [Spirochaetales bacterium]